MDYESPSEMFHSLIFIFVKEHKKLVVNEYESEIRV